MFCINCGQELPDGANFCYLCGAALGAILAAESNISLNSNDNVHVGNATIEVSGNNIDTLLQRIEMMLEDGEFYNVLRKCDSVLDLDPTNGIVYFYMLMASLRCKNRYELANQVESFENNPYFEKVTRFGDSNLQAEVKGYVNSINERNRAEQQRKDAEQEDRQKNPKVGDNIYFGTLKGDKLWWKVLKIQNNKALIISLDKIGKMCFQETKDRCYLDELDAVPWSHCTLRHKLNVDFVHECFNPGEIYRIVPSKLTIDDYRKYSFIGGVQTTDRVFILSIHEAETLFADNSARAGFDWWLRSPASCSRFIAFVNSAGRIIYDSAQNGYESMGVRPAMWIKLDKHS